MPDYFTLAEFRELPDMDDEAKFPDAAVEAAAASVVSIIERTVDSSFVARTVTGEAHDGRNSTSVILRSKHVLSVTSATENGVAVTDDLSATDGILQRYSAGSYEPSAWALGRRNISVTYEAGYSEEPPADIKEAALQATRYRLLTKAPTASHMDRATAIQNEFGNVQLSFADKEHPFGLPAVDAVVIGWRDYFGPSVS